MAAVSSAAGRLLRRLGARLYPAEPALDGILAERPSSSKKVAVPPSCSVILANAGWKQVTLTTSRPRSTSNANWSSAKFSWCPSKVRVVDPGRPIPPGWAPRWHPPRVPPPASARWFAARPDHPWPRGRGHGAPLPGDSSQLRSLSMAATRSAISLTSVFGNPPPPIAVSIRPRAVGHHSQNVAIPSPTMERLFHQAVGGVNDGHAAGSCRGPRRSAGARIDSARSLESLRTLPCTAGQRPPSGCSPPLPIANLGRIVARQEEQSQPADQGRDSAGTGLRERFVILSGERQLPLPAGDSAIISG